MGDWAEDKAREWLAWTDSGIRDIRDSASLAALLREVAGKDIAASYDRTWEDARTRLLAEVRRVVTAGVEELRQKAGHSPADMLEWNGKAQGAIWVRDFILSRLDKLA